MNKIPEIEKKILKFWQDKKLIELFDIEVGAHIVYGGVDLGFSPGQTLDFLLGWFGVDIGKDGSRFRGRDT